MNIFLKSFILSHFFKKIFYIYHILLVSCSKKVSLEEVSLLEKDILKNLMQCRSTCMEKVAPKKVEKVVVLKK